MGRDINKLHGHWNVRGFNAAHILNAKSSILGYGGASAHYRNFSAPDPDPDPNPDCDHHIPGDSLRTDPATGDWVGQCVICGYVVPVSAEEVERIHTRDTAHSMDEAQWEYMAARRLSPVLPWDENLSDADREMFAEIMDDDGEIPF
jgi:hypothetical protein